MIILTSNWDPARRKGDDEQSEEEKSMAPGGSGSGACRHHRRFPSLWDRPVANRFQIASAIHSSSYVSHHSAFEYYGITDQTYYDVCLNEQNFFPYWLLKEIADLWSISVN